MKVDIGGKVRSANDEIASRLRERFARAGVFVFNLISAPGSGKTALLEATARLIGDGVELAAIVGDIATQADADRLRAAGLRAHQIETRGSCHLDARMVETALESLPPEGLDLLAIENVGNLVCPASYDLGESLRFVLLSAPEGDDKPKKYPEAFLTSQVLVLTKADLFRYLPFDAARARREALDINPRLEIFTVSALTGEGMDALAAFLVGEREKLRTSHA